MKVYFFSNVGLCPECGSDDSQDYCFYNSFISFISNFVEKEVVILAGDFDYMLKVVQKIMRNSTKVMVLQSKNKEDEKILEICTTMDMRVGNIV